MRSTAPAVKMCGLTRRDDALTAAKAGARYVGAVLARGGKRTVTARAAAEIFAELPVQKVGVFVDADEREAVTAAECIGLDVLQLHGDEDLQTVLAIRDAGPWRIWKAVRPRTESDFERAVGTFGPYVDGVLVDGWSPDAPGGTGSKFQWDSIARQRELIPAGVLLIVAGGLNSSNVLRAIQTLTPDVVDVSSGVESSAGVKDAGAMRAFLAAANSNQS
ncbi:MAG TPA: phosphoribosylanthranilate isomerase [Longimicrobiaceae bacterium]|nr:phosphoribosylanthranilate isomerase [Longimicrobiaceae bacterium]